MALANGWTVGEGKWAGKWVHPGGKKDCSICRGRGCVDTDGSNGAFAATCVCVEDGIIMPPMEPHEGPLTYPGLSPDGPGEKPVSRQSSRKAKPNVKYLKQLDLFK